MGRITKHLVSFIQYLFAVFNLRIISRETIENVRMEERNKTQFDLRFLLAHPTKAHDLLLKYLPKSKSQLRQDLLVLCLEDFKRNGFFVEFGATNGVDLSNTYLLETEFGWNGILAEPAVCWQSELKLNRKANIEEKCVWSSSGNFLEFHQTPNAELSTVSLFQHTDLHKAERINGNKYIVETISINDLLSKYNAPRCIDYLSIDTEGSEFEILDSLDFKKYSFSVITCEHNFTSQRERIHGLLESHGYSRILSEISQFDDWYVKSDLIK